MEFVGFNVISVHRDEVVVFTVVNGKAWGQPLIYVTG